MEYYCPAFEYMLETDLWPKNDFVLSAQYTITSDEHNVRALLWFGLV